MIKQCMLLQKSLRKLPSWQRQRQQQQMLASIPQNRSAESNSSRSSSTVLTRSSNGPRGLTCRPDISKSFIDVDDSME